MSEQAMQPGGPAMRASDDVMHIPGEDGVPFFGLAREFLTDPRSMAHRMRDTYGPVYRIRFLGQRTVTLSGADALQLVLQDRDKNFSSAKGWDHSIGRLFARGLMLMDFDEHRLHRRIMQAAFKRDALVHYMKAMHDVSRQHLAAWRDARNFRFYPAIKQLTLDNAAVAFLGIELDERANALNQDFIDTVAASLAVVRVPVPGLALWRGLRARGRLGQFFESRIPERRASDMQDTFTRLCQTVDEEGQRYSDADIINHMIFLMMAAHDTVTSSLTTAAHALASYPEWQDRLRAEAEQFGDDPISYEQLDQLSDSEMLFNEALRLWGPVPYIPRRSVREFEFLGHRIPANVQVGVSPDGAHYDPQIWSHPDRFDPDRFSSERAEHRQHPFAFAPYGGGAHKCIGMHFAQILAKVFLRDLVNHFDLALPAGHQLRMQQVPIPKPVDGLPLKLTPRR
ncbi:MAG: cytochrome P450 [Pseudomonadota bacterium]